ncbi:MAG: glucose-1-phosphate adenylyltransferase subunit GlgD [Tissierellales bacterium]|nr:glucose-1-phosphate adenylyltransferase subunit GlgD [Tissierellales bacterium]MBN2827244.1 glucose-1-phosphate adenylyltransferase subunit GlgD [Tissierellales bacterium]
MKHLVGIIINSPKQKDLELMVRHRSIHTVPIGGKYRLIDFSLSNIVNSGISKIGVIGSYMYRSLVDHLGSGEEWNLSSKSNDLAILHGGKNIKIGEITRINLQDFIDNEAFFTKVSSSVEDVVLCGCNIICNFDLKEAIKFHRENQADITMVHKEDYTGELSDNEAVMEVMDHKVTKLGYSADRRAQSHNVYADMMIIKKELLQNIIEDVKTTGEIDLLDVITNNLENLNIFAYPIEGYFKIINSRKSYFDCSMELLHAEIQREIFHGERKIYTKTKDNHPAIYSVNSKIKNSLVASGTIINGSVENAIISREAIIEEGVKIKNSVIMQNCVIEKDTIIVNAILDKYVRVTSGKVLVGTEKEPLMIRKDSVI